MRDWSRQVVVTGVGVCCNLGHDMVAIERALQEGRGGRFGRWQPAVDFQARCQINGQYEGDLSDQALGVSKKESRFLSRASRLALRAARAALAGSGLATRDLGIIVGSGTGDVETHRKINAQLDKRPDCKRTSPTVIPKLMASTVSANLVNVLRAQGPSVTASAACAGGAYNLLIAAQLIEAGHMDAALAGGVDIADIHFHGGFDAMRAYNSQDNDDPHRASRPYAADRAGFVFGEGAGILALETRGSAERRGVPILGAIRGFGMSSDGQGQMVAPSQEGAVRAVNKALDHAELSPADIDYVNTHGTSTPVGDVSEVAAMRSAFGDHRPAYSSTKGYTGHTISAAGAIEAIFTLAMLRGGWIAPSVHASPLDPSLEDYPPVQTPRKGPLGHAMSNSFGFGGTNVSLVLSREPRPL